MLTYTPSPLPSTKPPLSSKITKTKTPTPFQGLRNNWMTPYHLPWDGLYARLPVLCKNIFHISQMKFKFNYSVFRSVLNFKSVLFILFRVVVNSCSYGRKVSLFLYIIFYKTHKNLKNAIIHLRCYKLLIIKSLSAYTVN